MWQPVIPPTVPSVTPAPRPRLATQRHEQGRAHLGTVLNWWLKRSDLSHERMARIADWGLGDNGFLIASQISHLRRRNVVRGASSKALDAMAGANRAIWLWHTAGPRGAAQELGSHLAWEIEPEWLDGATWLPKPEDDTKPLDFVDFCQINSGYLTLPYLEPVALSPRESAVTGAEVADLLNRLAAGGTPAEGIARVLAAYPVDDVGRQQRLRGLMLGEPWSTEELEGEMLALAMTISTLRCLPEGSYGPAELHAELSSQRRRT